MINWQKVNKLCEKKHRINSADADLKLSQRCSWCLIFGKWMFFPNDRFHIRLLRKWNKILSFHSPIFSCILKNLTFVRNSLCHHFVITLFDDSDKINYRQNELISSKFSPLFLYFPMFLETFWKHLHCDLWVYCNEWKRVI